jgi:hypothetical protein
MPIGHSVAEGTVGRPLRGLEDEAPHCR